MEEAEREEEEGEEESPKELEPEEEEIAMATGAGGLVFSALLGFGRKKEFAVKKSRFEVRLNRKRGGSWIGSFTFYEEPVAETLHLPWWLQQF